MNQSSRNMPALRILVTLGLVLLVLKTVPAQNVSQEHNSTVQNGQKEANDVEQRRMFRVFGQRREAAASRASKKKGRNADDTLIGLTIWELRKSEAGIERRSFKLKKPNGETTIMRPFRLGSESSIVVSRCYVFGVQSARSGYLYVINRERFIGGKLGEPLLIFPSKAVRSGKNTIAAGDMVEIPDQKLEKAYFEATRSGQDHLGEALTFIISPKPLIDPERIRDEPITLEHHEVLNWERQWSGRIRWIENTETTGNGYSEAEARAGEHIGYKLKKTDPLPHRLYKLSAKPGAPLLLTVFMRYGEEPTTPENSCAENDRKLENTTKIN